MKYIVGMHHIAGDCTSPTNLVPGGDVTVDRCGLQEGGGVRSLHWNTEESIRHAPVQVGRPKDLLHKRPCKLKLICMAHSYQRASSDMYQRDPL